MAVSTRGHGRARGGRGERGGGRYKPGEFELMQDPDYDRSKPQPTPLFPAYSPAPPKSLTKIEKRQVAHFLAFRRRVNDGPYYTVLDEEDEYRVGKQRQATSTTKKAIFDPFEGMPTFTQKYGKRRRTVPDLGGRSYVMRFFPKELWSTIDPKNHLASGPQGMTKPGTAQRQKEQDLAEAEGDTMGMKGEDVDVDVDDENRGEEEVRDDDFEEEEGDEGDDYNAEQYFDGNQDEVGEEMDVDEGDAGGDYY